MCRFRPTAQRKGTKMSVKVVLQKKIRANGQYPVMLRIWKNSKAQFISVGATSPEKDWDTQKELPKKSHPLYQELVIKIQQAKVSAGKALLVGEETDTRTVLEKAVQKEAVEIGILAYCLQTVGRLKAENRHGYAETFKYAGVSLGKMLPRGRKDFAFTEITPQLLRKWESRLLQEGAASNTIGIHIGRIRVLMGYARLEKITRHNPFLGEERFNLSKYSRIETPKRAVHKDHITAISDLQTEENTPAFHSRNFFLFSFYTKGMNFSDIADIEPRHRDGNYLVYQRRKTGKWQRVFLLEPAREIWDYYCRTGLSRPGQQTVFWFILGPLHKTVDQRVYRKKRVLRQINKELRLMAAELGITQHMTTYVARHSFASILKHSGVPVDQISELLGHDSVTTTRIYLQNFEQEVLNDAVRNLL